MRSSLKQRAFAHGFLLILLGVGFWIWQCALNLHDFSSESALLLAGLPLAFICGAPWTKQEPAASIRTRSLLASIALLMVGSTLQSIVLMALAWAGLFDAWARATYRQTNRARHSAAYMAFLSFPWLAIEGHRIGWWFRDSGAQVGAFLFQQLGFPVHRQGTTVFVDQLPVDVTEACSGLQTLQVFLLVGGLLAWRETKTPRDHVLALALLPAAAWLANTLRIALVTVSGLTFGVDLAGGALHAWLGIISSLVVLALYLWAVRSMSHTFRPIRTIHQPLATPNP